MGVGSGGMGRAVAGGFAGGVFGVAAIVVWVVAAFWNWSFFGSSDVEPGQKVFLYFVAPIVLGAATVPVSVGLGAGWRRVSGVFGFVSAAACFVCVMAVEGWTSFPWQIIIVGSFALPGMAAFFAVFGRGGIGRSIPVFVGLFAAGVVFGVAAVLAWGSAEGVWVGVALFAVAWVVFPAVAQAAKSGWGIGGEG